MKLTTRLISLIVATLGILLVVDGIMEIRQERRSVRQDMSEGAKRLGHAMSGPFLDQWKREGRSSALEFLDEFNAGREPLAVRWVSLSDEADPAFAPRAPLDEVLPLPSPHGRSIVLPAESGSGLLGTYIPLRMEDGSPGALEVTESLADLDRRTTRRIRRVLLLLAALGVSSAVTVFVLGFYLLGNPLKKLDAKARRIGRGDYSEPLRLRGRSELSTLAETVNVMCDQIVESQARLEREMAQKLEVIDQLRHADRLRTVGRLASGVAHELGTPLNVVTGRASLILRGTLPSEEVQESAQIIKQQGERMAEVIQNLLNFSRRRTTEKGPVDLGQVVATACKLVTPGAKKQGVRVSVERGQPEECTGRGNAAELQQVVVNLVMNAIQSMEGGGEVTVEVARRMVRDPKHLLDSDPRSWICIAVRDQGAGIEEEHLHRVFEPFFTTKEVGSGVGLGLSIVFGILQDHDGWIEVESTLGEGSTFTCFVPEMERPWTEES